MSFVGAFASGERAILDMQLGINSTGTSKRGKYAEDSALFPSTVHTLTVVTEYVRLRVIDMGSGLNGEVQAIFHGAKSGKLTAFIGETVNKNNDCELVRAVLTGEKPDGNYENVLIDTEQRLSVGIAGPVTGFGSVSTQKQTVISQLRFVYGLTGSIEETFTPYGTYVTMGTEGGGATAQVQSIYLPKGASFTSSGNGDYFTLTAGGGGAFYVWYDVSSGNDDPTPSGTGIEVDVTASDTPAQVASATQTAVDGNANFSATVFGSIVTITNAASGDVSSIDCTNMPLASNSSITSTKGSSMVSLTNGAGVADYAVLRGKRQVHNAPGLSSLVRWSGVYASPAAGIDQYFGIGNSTNALYFGYNGLNFGISRRSAGLHKVATLQVTSVAGASDGTVIVTVDGIDVTVTIDDITSVQTVAQNIADADFRTALYSTDIINDTVTFLSERISAGTGTNTFAFALGTATNISATAAEVTAASDATNTKTRQEDFNFDRLDGSGPSGMVFDPEKLNVCQLQFHNSGQVKFQVENPKAGNMTTCHTIQYANNNTLPLLNQPDMQLTAFITSTTATTSKTIKLMDACAIIEGEFAPEEPVFTAGHSHTGATAASTNEILLAVKNPRVFNGLTNQVELFLENVAASSTKSANNTKATTTFSVAFGGTPSADLVFTELSSGVSSAAVATPAKGVTLNGGTKRISGSVAAEGVFASDITQQKLRVPKNTTVYVIYTTSAISNGSIDLDASLTWAEAQ
jgi:hypothetical protein